MSRDDIRAASVIGAVLDWADRRPDAPAVGFLGADGWTPPVSYAGLRRAIYGAAHVLARNGVEPGDRVVLAIDTGLPAVAGFFGAQALGAVPVMVAPWLGGLGGGALYVKKLTQEVALVRARLAVVPGTMAPHLAGIGAPLLAEDALREEADAPPRPVDATEDQLCTLQLTSGSTGSPRAVRVTHRNSIANAEALNDISGDGESVVSWLPLFHDMGLQGQFLFTLLYGNAAYLIPPARFVREPEVLIDAIHRFRGAHTVGPNFSYPLLARALARRTPDPEVLSSVRACWNGAEPIHAASLRNFLEVAAPFGFDPGVMLPCFGLGEATLVVTCARRGDGVEVDRVERDALAAGVARPAAPGVPAVDVVCCGAPVRHAVVEIVDEEGRQVDERRVGEVTVGGAVVCPGYDGDEEATRTTFRDGRVYTGDLGYLAGGKLHLVGRRKDILVVNGQKYAPQAVEWAAESVEGVRRGRSAAFSVPDATRGTEEVVVGCETNLPPDQHPEVVRQVIARVLEETGLRVSAYLFPAGITPKTSSGKVRRQEARAMFLEHFAARPTPAR